MLVGTHRRAHHADPADVAFGIYTFELNGNDGTFVQSRLTETPSPGWLAVHPNGRTVFAVNEVRKIGDREGGAISAFAIDGPSGTLRLINTAPLPPMPCHCVVEASGRYLIAATFGGGSIHMFVLAADGSIAREVDCHAHTGSGVHPKRQTAPHAHAIVLSPDNRFVLVPDLGIDRILIYEVDHAAGRLIPLPENTVVLAPLSGPRHAVFSADARFFYLINEMNATIGVFGYDAGRGRLTALQSVNLLPEGFTGLRSGAAIALHPDGSHLYATTRSHGSSGMPSDPGLDSLIWFSIDEAIGLLTCDGRISSGGAIPRSMAFSPFTGHLHVAHQCSGTIVEFTLNEGVPTPLGNILATPVPVCLAFASKQSG